MPDERVSGLQPALLSHLPHIAFTRPGVVGLVTVITVELAIIICMSLYNPVLAIYRLEHTPKDRIARTLTAWSISSSASIAVFTALGGLLASATSPRTAITVAGLLILISPVLSRRAWRQPSRTADTAAVMTLEMAAQEPVSEPG